MTYKLLIALVLLPTSIACNRVQYGINDCLVVSGDHIYKVIEVGKYSVKTVRPTYDGYEEWILNHYDLNGSTNTDCFDLFDNYKTKGSK